MNDFLWSQLAKSFEALSPLLLAALSWLSIQIASLINARVKNERVRTVLQRLDDAVFVAVREVEQVLVASLRNASADGALSIEVTHQSRRDDLGTGGIQAGSQQGGCDCQLEGRSRTSGKRFGACARPSAKA